MSQNITDLDFSLELHDRSFFAITINISITINANLYILGWLLSTLDDRFLVLKRLMIPTIAGLRYIKLNSNHKILEIKEPDGCT